MFVYRILLVESSLSAIKRLLRFLPQRYIDEINGNHPASQTLNPINLGSPFVFIDDPIQLEMIQQIWNSAFGFTSKIMPWRIELIGI